jgi:hypothetical protein
MTKVVAGVADAGLENVCALGRIFSQRVEPPSAVTGALKDKAFHLRWIGFS